MEQEKQIDVMIAEASHEVYVDTILETIEAAAKVRGTGIAKRTHEYVAQKMKEGKAVIALEGDKFAGFSYIESWGNKQYVTTSGLIVHPDYRGLGIAKRIKEMTFQLARMRWPHAKIFSLTSGAAVMKMNTELGYVPVTFADLTDEEALDRVLDLKIMSRARPTDKQRLVQLLQQKGAVVAVTGDGTNDAPALNHAQVGLSMGTGTSVAKEASDITLLDDSFNSIGTAVMWGRSLYKNIQRFIVFQLTINFVALLIVLLGSVIGTELPLTVTQMLWVNLIMDTFAALALASIPPSETVMLEKPRRSTDFIISKAMRSNILGVGSIFLIVLLGMIYYFDHSAKGMDVHNLTIFFTFFVMLQFWNLFNARVFGTTDSAFKGLSKSYGMELIVLAILVGQFLIVQFGGAVFRTEPLDWQTWLLIIGVSSMVLWVGELVRLVQRIIHKRKRNEK